MKITSMTMDEYLQLNPFNYSEEVLAQQKVHYEEYLQKNKGGFGTYNREFTEIIRIVKGDDANVE